MKKILIYILFTFMIFIPVVNVNADAETLQDLYDELSVLKQKQSAASLNKKLTEEQITSLNNQIGEVNENIIKTREEIVTANKSIEESKKKIQEKTEETKELLRFLQTSSGENVYLQYLFEAEDYTDFIYRFAIVSQLSEYNNGLMNELEALVQELENKKVELAKKVDNLNSYQKDLNNKLTTLKINLTDIKTEGTTIEEDIKAKQVDINYYEKLGCTRTQKLSVCSATPYAYGWNLPFIGGGWVTSEYTTYRTDIMSGTAHWGIDIGLSEGTRIYPAAAGRVAWITWRGSCGGNMVWIYHTVNGKKYTTAYYHLLTINVSVDQIVTTNTIIGTSGGYSTSAMSRNQCSITFVGRGGYDYCTCGGHLHFGVANGNDVGSFNAYSFNPRELPILSKGSYFSRWS